MISLYRRGNFIAFLDSFWICFLFVFHRNGRICWGLHAHNLANGFWSDSSECYFFLVNMSKLKLLID